MNYYVSDIELHQVMDQLEQRRAQLSREIDDATQRFEYALDNINSRWCAEPQGDTQIAQMEEDFRQVSSLGEKIKKLQEELNSISTLYV